MATRLPRADYVLLDNENGARLVAIYPANVQPDAVRPAAVQLDALAGVKARVVTGAVDDPAGPRLVMLEMTIESQTSLVAAVRLFKKLTDPTAPITLTEFRLSLLLCDCGYVSSRIDALQFVNGFDPTDDEAFMLRVFAGLKEIPMATLLAESVDDPDYTPIMNALELMLGTLGAHASAIHLTPQPDPRPCTHPA